VDRRRNIYHLTTDMTDKDFPDNRILYVSPLFDILIKVPVEISHKMCVRRDWNTK